MTPSHIQSATIELAREIRNVSASLALNAYLATKTEEDEARNARLDRISDTAKRLTSLIKALLAVSGLET